MNEPDIGIHVKANGLVVEIVDEPTMVFEGDKAWANAFKYIASIYGEHRQRRDPGVEIVYYETGWGGEPD